ncbi:UDP-glucose dehydrogenase [Prochlorococcus marinus str. MIT 9321]|uniref:UDP-glucose 6-dehydrogenase n=1 Tax=Prochlorococcus marinus str. MIT 9401 TaxID=167551 RepID=A0A0A2BCV8_PROMR|nr:nucleotide sugar dehydrogenase [Prochlorococcus marinus]KGG02888.1 UDP-glucose dehydrogenase [Prochlorococcus marinus str. MIT 9321]KGG05511.1 UDP-glucose dehydrogenase [Prochlorococcus marinus str. MIT 9322]KGG10545.1 UDP-glucose dehydrogenase [Prochlorococcus marinus str. MIT 9401]
MKIKVKTICCIGAGYVGGPTMAVIADKCKDLKVIVVDLDKKRISDWNSEDLTKLPVYEPGLGEIIERCRGKNLFFTNKVSESIAQSDMIFISVNTPTKTTGLGAGEASDLKYVENCAREIASSARGHTIVVEKSTIPVKTAEVIKNILSSSQKNSQKNKTKSFSVLSSPEFLAEGTAINDLINPSRVLIGGENNLAINALIDIYKNWVSEDKIIKTNIWSSELSKLTANAFLAQRVSSINSISALCEKTGADISEVAKAVGMDYRIGEHFLKSGPGFGGSCFKKDILNLIYISKLYGLEEVAKYWKQVIEINQWQQERLTNIIVKNLFGTVSNKKIAILGFAFKENTNDTRESPAINICTNLLIEGAKLSIYDPKVDESKITYDLNQSISAIDPSLIINDKVETVSSYENLAEGADAIVILTEWYDFKKIDWSNLSKLMRKPSWIFDCRDVVDFGELQENSLNIWKLGHGFNINFKNNYQIN